MKNRYLAVLVAGACISLASFNLHAQTIEAYGDSITTFGASPESSYRFWLYVDLTNAHYTGFSFVGTKFGADNGTPANSWPDEAYAGTEGWDTATALGATPGAINVAGGPPDIVLLEFGANDVENGEPLTNTESNLEGIIGDFAAANSGVTIFLAVPTRYVIPAGTPPASVQQQRSGMAKIGGVINRVARTERAAGIRVIVVNLMAGYNPHIGADTIDGTHPNIKGEKQLARKFFNALRASGLLTKG